MKVLLSIYDRKMAMHTLLLVFATVEEGVRSFEDSLTPDNRITHHPEDYTLMLVGHLDEDTGRIVQDDAHPSMIVSADMIMERKELTAQKRRRRLENLDMFDEDGTNGIAHEMRRAFTELPTQQEG